MGENAYEVITFRYLHPCSYCGYYLLSAYEIMNVLGLEIVISAFNK
jgi:hypothetical protein